MATTDSTVPAAAGIDPPEPMDIENVAPLFGICSDKFGQLAALFDVIRRKADSHSDLYTLAALGWDVAMDYENQADHWNEQVRGGGIRQ